MQPPYDLRQFAERAGRTPDPTPAEAEVPRCPGCGVAVPPTRTYCGRAVCRALWVRRGKGKPSDEPLPLIEQYSA